jgi:hypothetical protein
MVKGSVPGVKGGWVSRARCGEAQASGRCSEAGRLQGRPEAAQAPAASKALTDMKARHHTIDAQTAGSHRARRRTSSVSSRAPTSCTAWSSGSSTSASRARIRPSRAAKISRTTKKLGTARRAGWGPSRFPQVRHLRRRRQGLRPALPQPRDGAEQEGPRPWPQATPSRPRPRTSR